MDVFYGEGEGSPTSSAILLQKLGVIQLNSILTLSTMVKSPPANAGDAGDMGSVPGLGRSPRGGHGNPLQYSCLENPMDRGAWWAPILGVQSQIRPSD